MEKIKHELLLDGTIQDGYSLETAFEKLTRLFRSNADRFTPLLDGKPVSQSINITPEHAEKLRTFLASIGLRGQVLPETPPAADAPVDLVAMAGMDDAAAAAPGTVARQPPVEDPAPGDTSAHDSSAGGGMKLQLVPVEEESEKENATPAAAPQFGMICPGCGMDQKPSEQCIACGIYFAKYRAQQSAEAIDAAAGATATGTDGGADAPTLEDSMLDYVRDNAYYYDGRFDAFRAGGDRFRPGWHWPGFLFPFHWALYRKLWLWAAALFIVPVLLTPVIPLFSLVVINALFALSANFIYYKHVKQAVTRLRRHRRADPETLATAGGTSWPAVVAGLLLPAVFSGVLVSWMMPDGFRGLKGMQTAYDTRDPQVMKTRQGQETFLNMTMAKLAIAVSVRQGKIRSQDVDHEHLVDAGMPASNLIDGWGTPFRVSADGTEITIVSAGPDREFDTVDDLKQ